MLFLFRCIVHDVAELSLGAVVFCIFSGFLCVFDRLGASATAHRFSLQYVCRTSSELILRCSP